MNNLFTRMGWVDAWSTSVQEGDDIGTVSDSMSPMM